VAHGYMFLVLVPVCFGLIGYRFSFSFSVVGFQVITRQSLNGEGKVDLRDSDVQKILNLLFTHCKSEEEGVGMWWLSVWESRCSLNLRSWDLPLR
jgi:hypothetical protein